MKYELDGQGDSCCFYREVGDDTLTVATENGITDNAEYTETPDKPDTSTPLGIFRYLTSIGHFNRMGKNYREGYLFALRMHDMISRDDWSKEYNKINETREKTE